MRAITPEAALRHPVWSMGAKISIDSATMMNKGLEVIEAARLFALPSEKIEVLVHPQSVIHGMVCYADGSVLAQLGSPDMRIPIAHTLAWPQRIATEAPRLDLAAIARLDFFAPDEARFPALRLAREALVAGAGAPAVLNAANEIAVAAFLARQIGFLDIAGIVETVLQQFGAPPVPDLEAVLALDRAARGDRQPACHRKGRLMIHYSPLHPGLCRRPWACSCSFTSLGITSPRAAKGWWWRRFPSASARPCCPGGTKNPARSGNSPPCRLAAT